MPYISTYQALPSLDPYCVSFSDAPFFCTLTCMLLCPITHELKVSSFSLTQIVAEQLIKMSSSIEFQGLRILPKLPRKQCRNKIKRQLQCRGALPVVQTYCQPFRQPAKKSLYSTTCYQRRVSYLLPVYLKNDERNGYHFFFFLGLGCFSAACFFAVCSLVAFTAS
jgi:hypothetical protein